MNINAQTLKMQELIMTSLNSCKKRYACRMEEMCNQFYQSMEGLLEELVKDVLMDVSANFGNHINGAASQSIQAENHFNEPKAEYLPVLEEAASALEMRAEEDDITQNQMVNESYFAIEKSISETPVLESNSDDAGDVTIVKEEFQGTTPCPDLNIASSVEPPEIALPTPSVPLSDEAANLVCKVSKDCYQCRQCWREFRVRRYAEQHVRTHTGERPFACHLCGRPFTQRSTMYRHLREAHFRMKHSECPICHKTFSRELTMKRHALTHVRDELGKEIVNQ